LSNRYRIELNFNLYSYKPFENRRLPIYGLKHFFLQLDSNQLECVTLIAENQIDSAGSYFVKLDEINEVQTYFQARGVIFKYLIHTPLYDPALGANFDHVLELPDNTYEMYSKPSPMRLDKRWQHAYYKHTIRLH
jgi:hypothetical protein